MRLPAKIKSIVVIKSKISLVELILELFGSVCLIKPFASLIYPLASRLESPKRFIRRVAISSSTTLLLPLKYPINSAQFLADIKYAELVLKPIGKRYRDISKLLALSTETSSLLSSLILKYLPNSFLLFLFNSL